MNKVTVLNSDEKMTLFCLNLLIDEILDIGLTIFVFYTSGNHTTLIAKRRTKTIEIFGLVRGIFKE